MSRSLVEQIAAIHRVDLGQAGLGFLGDGRHFLERQLDALGGRDARASNGARSRRWSASLAELVAQQPEPSPTVTLVHGDPKPGNFAFVDDEVSAVFDWELTTLGDPLADVGCVEVHVDARRARSPVRPGGAHRRRVRRAATRSSPASRCVHREWYRAFQGFKMAVIMLVGAMLFDSGVTDDPRMGNMALGVHPFTTTALRDLGIVELYQGEQ